MELGEESIKEHAGIVDLIASNNWNKVVLVGKDYLTLPSGVIHFNSSLEAKEWYHQQHFTDCLILIKGSRSMQMEKIVE